ncbi:MAG: class II aldolase/adducin family protein [Bacteroidales bacterium]|nr:class II aldolase/adducin family protein [Bacteroidales bacterium]
MKIDEGYIKFNCVWTKSDFNFPDNLFQDLSSWRKKLYTIKLIGAYDDGIGFGNISARLMNEQFIITGSATGNKPDLMKNDYALVTQYQLDKNQVESSGHTKASSEAMSHAAIYECSPDIQAVIHIHHLALWEELMHTIPTTNENVPFGTPEMAWEIMRLYKASNLPEKKIIAMGGHKEGIIAFGKDLNEAGNIILRYYNKYILL